MASPDWAGALNSWMPVSYRAMGRWMLEEAATSEFVWEAPLVSRVEAESQRFREPTAVGFVDSVVGSAEQPIVLFSLEWCEFCWSVRKFFKALDVPYRSIDLVGACTRSRSARRISPPQLSC